MSESTCVTCEHPRGDHREGLYECTSCSCPAFKAAPEPRPAPEPEPPVRGKAKRPATRKRR